MAKRQPPKKTEVIKVETPKKIVKKTPPKKEATVKKGPPKRVISENIETPKKENVKKTNSKKEVIVKDNPIKKETTVKKPNKLPAEFAGEDTKQVPVASRIGPAKTKNVADTKYIRIPENSDIEKFKEMSLRIQNKSIQWAYYAIDGDKGYHYYMILKN